MVAIAIVMVMVSWLTNVRDHGSRSRMKVNVTEQCYLKWNSTSLHNHLTGL